MLFCPKCGTKLTTPETGVEENKPFIPATTVEADKQEAISSRRTKRNRLYRQWVKYAGLPEEKIPSIKTPKDMLTRGTHNVQQSYLIYILLGIGIVICIVLAILLVKFW